MPFVLFVAISSAIKYSIRERIRYRHNRETEMEDYKDKVVIVTGACGGIGEVIAEKMADAGAALGLCDINRSKLEQIADKFQRAGTRVHQAATDVSKEDEVCEFCDAVSNNLGKIDCLINTVGIVDCQGDIEELSLSMWEKTIGINLTSAFLMAKYSLPHIKEQGGGAILNISSVSGLANQAKAMIYSVTKAALLSLTRSEAIDLAPHKIRANSISPGSVYTPLLDDALRDQSKIYNRTEEEQLKVWESQYPTQRFSTPQEIAELALFLCSERASNITGSNFVIDGGLTSLLPER